MSHYVKLPSRYCVILGIKPATRLINFERLSQANININCAQKCIGIFLNQTYFFLSDNNGT